MGTTTTTTICSNGGGANANATSGKPGTTVAAVFRNNRTRLPANRELPSLESMLMANDKPSSVEDLEDATATNDVVDDANEDEENFIPLKDIQEFRARLPVVARQREELRKTLRLRFN